MTNGRIIFVEPDKYIRDQIIMILMEFGYQVECVADNQSVLAALQPSGKQMVILSAALPDALEQVKNLRTSSFSHMPCAITAFHREFDRAEKLAFIEAGVDAADLLSKENMTDLWERIELTLHPHTYFQNRHYLMQYGLFELLLKDLISSDFDWAYFDMSLRNFDEYVALYGRQAQAAILDVVSAAIATSQARYGTSDDVWYTPTLGNWVGVVFAVRPRDFMKQVQTAFLAKLKTRYNPVDWERGYILVPDQHGAFRECALMNLVIDMLTPKQYEYKSMVDLIEACGEKRHHPPIIEW